MLCHFLYLYLVICTSRWWQVQFLKIMSDLDSRFGKLQASPHRLNLSQKTYRNWIGRLFTLQSWWTWWASPLCRAPFFLCLRAASSLGLIHQGLSLLLKRKNRLAAPKALMATSPSIQRWLPLVPWDRGLLAGLKMGAAALNCRLPRRAPGLHSGVWRRSKLDEVPMSVLKAYLDVSRCFASFFFNTHVWHHVYIYIYTHCVQYLYIYSYRMI